MLLFLLCLSSYRLPTPFAQNTPAPGEVFPDLKLPLPQKMEEREHLKIDRGPFLPFEKTNRHAGRVFQGWGYRRP
jgi:hypothetical protein